MSLAATVLAALLTIDPLSEVGPVKPVNGVGQPPMVGKLAGWEMMHYLKDAGIPYSRLHDVDGWLGGGLFVDIPNLFPDFSADESDPANYRFAYTDNLISKLVANGVEPFFRLGITIENFVGRGLPGLRTNPPSDSAKWARVAEHVIAHYTEGWAKGFRHRIEYWEIWNEPDNEPDPKRNPMWKGDWKSFCDFYGIVAPHLKRRFPKLKIGGYGSCGFYAAVGAGQVKSANSSPRLDYFVDCATNFLVRAKREGWPLDFFSFHSYSSPDKAIQQVRYADRLLTACGFPPDRTERIFNEWLPSPSHERLGTDAQAADIAAELVGLQNGPCDLACIYDARCDVGSYSPLFNPMTRRPHKAYEAFLAFNELRKLGTAVACTVEPPLRACAAAKNGSVAVLVVNPSGKPCWVEPKGVPGLAPMTLPPHSFSVLKSRTENEKKHLAPFGSTGVLLLSFDDRNFEDWVRAIPIFEKYNAHATFFVSGEFTPDVVHSVKKLMAAGHSIGLHGQHHANVKKLVVEKGWEAYCAQELDVVMRQCDAAHIPVRNFAYPNGYRDEATDKLLLGRFDRVRGPITKGVRPYDPKGEKKASLKPLVTDERVFFPVAELPKRRVLDRVLIGEAYNTDIDDVAACIRRAGERKEVLVLASHGIHPNARKIHMKTEWLEKILATAQECGVSVLGFEEVPLK